MKNNRIIFAILFLLASSSFLVGGEIHQAAQKMGNSIDSDKLETTPLVSPDGKCLFSVSQRNGGVGEVY